MRAFIDPVALSGILGITSLLLAQPAVAENVKEARRRTIADKSQESLGAAAAKDNGARSRRAPRSGRRPARKLAKDTPLAGFPAFRTMPDGTSHVWLSVSKKQEVKVANYGLLATFEITKAAQLVRNNGFPLVTTAFETPIKRVHLRETKAGVVLRIALREPAKLRFRIKDAPDGGMVLEVVAPPPSARSTSGRVRMAVSRVAKSNDEVGYQALPEPIAAPTRRGRRRRATRRARGTQAEKTTQAGKARATTADK